METATQISNANTSDIMEYSLEFKEEMENSICNYFNKCQLDSDQQKLNETKELIRDNTLIDNKNQDVEYITPSLKGISNFMIHQVFSTERIVPIDSSSEEGSIHQEDEKEKEVEDDNDNDKTNITTNLNTCNSDETLNEEITEILNTTSEDPEILESNVMISESFATEFISLLDINLKELNNKKDDFHVIGLKKIEEEEKKVVEPSTETPEVKIKEEFLESNPKSRNKRSKHNSVLLTIKRRCSSTNLRLFRSKSIDFKSIPKNHDSSSSTVVEAEDNKLKKSKSKSRLSLSRIIKTVKKRISSQSLSTSKKEKKKTVN